MNGAGTDGAVGGIAGKAEKPIWLIMWSLPRMELLTGFMEKAISEALPVL